MNEPVARRDYARLLRQGRFNALSFVMPVSDYKDNWSNITGIFRETARDYGYEGAKRTTRKNWFPRIAD